MDQMEKNNLFQDYEEAMERLKNSPLALYKMVRERVDNSIREEELTLS